MKEEKKDQRSPRSRRLRCCERLAPPLSAFAKPAYDFPNKGATTREKMVVNLEKDMRPHKLGLRHDICPASTPTTLWAKTPVSFRASRKALKYLNKKRLFALFLIFVSFSLFYKPSFGQSSRRSCRCHDPLRITFNAKAGQSSMSKKRRRWTLSLKKACG